MTRQLPPGVHTISYEPVVAAEGIFTNGPAALRTAAIIAALGDEFSSETNNQCLMKFQNSGNDLVLIR